LHRKRLASLGLAPEWITPPLKENFSHVMVWFYRYPQTGRRAGRSAKSWAVGLEQVRGQPCRMITIG
jgi:hypothetical protein